MGGDNQRIIAHIKENNLDRQYRNPVEMRHIYDTRGDLRRKGLIDKEPEFLHTSPMQVKTPPEPELETRVTLQEAELKALIKRTIAETLNKTQTNTPVNPIEINYPEPQYSEIDDIIELEGGIITRKTVGFTPKSLMLFDLTRQKGFRGNFADFVNSCIYSAMKDRKFKLTVDEEG